MMLTSTVNLLQTLCLSAGVHAEVMQSDATRTLCGLLRMLVESGTIDKSGILQHSDCAVCLFCALLPCKFVNIFLLVFNPFKANGWKVHFQSF